jgi:hypothetical protein
VNAYRRRKTDVSPWGNILFAISRGNIDVVLLLGALGLLAWVGFGITSAKADMANYAAMFPLGTVEFWIGAYLFAAVGLIYLVAYQLPPLASLIVGGWLTVIWSWSFFARAQAVYTAQTGNECHKHSLHPHRSSHTPAER